MVRLPYDELVYFCAGIIVLGRWQRHPTDLRGFIAVTASGHEPHQRQFPGAHSRGCLTGSREAVYHVVMLDPLTAAVCTLPQIGRDVGRPNKVDDEHKIKVGGYKGINRRLTLCRRLLTPFGSASLIWIATHPRPNISQPVQI